MSLYSTRSAYRARTADATADEANQGVEDEVEAPPIMRRSAPISPITRAALAGLEAQRQEEETGLLQQTSDIQQALQQDAAGRGVTRSGFAGEAMTDLSSREAGALAAIQSGHKRRVQDYHSRMAAMRRERKQNRRARRNRWIGAALGAGAMIATGGAAAPLVAGYMSSQGQSF